MAGSLNHLNFTSVLLKLYSQPMMHQQGMNPAAFAEIELIPETHHEPYFSINCENTTGEFSLPLIEQDEAALQRLKIKLSDKRVKSSFKRSFIFPFIKIVRRNNS